MGINVDRVGTFRCRLVEKGLNKTKEKKDNEKDPGGYPQLMTKVVMTGLYDEKGGEDGKPTWFPIEDWDMGITAYSCLYGFLKKEKEVGKTLTCQQIMKVFSWDGVSLAELVTKDDDGLEFQIRIEENDPEYADKTPFQVSWIDVFDADPARTLRKLDAAEIKALDKQFSNLGASAKTAASAKGLKTSAKAKPHPARVPADDVDGKKTPKAPVNTTGPKAPKTMTPAEKKAAMKAKSERVKAANKKAANQTASEAVAAAAAPPVPDEDGPPEDKLLDLPEVASPITKADAWAGIFEGRDETIDDKTVKELWDAAIEEVAGEGAKHADVTGEQWAQVKKIVLADCGKFE
jgi:hypothetical protein